MDLARYKERQSHTWGLVDYSWLSGVLAPAAQALCDACAVSAGQEVLDVAAGDGNFALACAREGAGVVASDLTPAMVERGGRRTREEGFDVEWVEADVEELPFEDSRFDCAASVFGAVFAPRPEVAAAAMFRVVRPGGTVGLTTWIPGSFPPDLFGVGRRYAPPPPELPPGEQWGDEDTARARLDGLAARVDFVRGSLTWEGESPEALASTLERNVPTQVAIRSALSPDQQEAMHDEVVETVRRWNGGDGPVSVDTEYLLIVARKRG